MSFRIDRVMREGYGFAKDSRAQTFFFRSEDCAEGVWDQLYRGASVEGRVVTSTAERNNRLVDIRMTPERPYIRATVTRVFDTGFGFAQTANGVDHFFHAKDVGGFMEDLIPGTVIEGQLHPHHDARGPRLQNIRIV